MNVKPGDLAIFVVSPTGVNLGKLVRVIRKFNPPEEIGGRIWVSGQINEPCFVIESLGSPIQYRMGSFMEGAAPASWLRPIRGLLETETTDEQIKEPAC
jgi:hypothetical protein